MTVWLEDERANVGDRVTLKDSDSPEREWTVAEAYSSQDHDSLNRTNNFGKSIKGRGSLVVLRPPLLRSEEGGMVGL